MREENTIFDVSKVKIENRILVDSFERKHNYLRISLTENCNLRCNYCMPEETLQLSPKSHLMQADEVFGITQAFVAMGVDKIRLTGGEPLVRKDFSAILKMLATLEVNISLTTNAVLLDRFFDVLEKYKVKNLNISLDSLNKEKNQKITKRNHLEKTQENIQLALEKGFKVKLNCVLIKGTNEDEIIDFIRLGEKQELAIRFIEFMPFQGNQWDRSKIVSQKEILEKAEYYFGKSKILLEKSTANDTSRNYRIKDYLGTFGIISSVTNPFCDSCNRLRLTANGQMKNCLFSTEEEDILGQYRKGKDIKDIVRKHLLLKKEVRNGMNSLSDLNDTNKHDKNRSMIRIGG